MIIGKPEISKAIIEKKEIITLSALRSVG